VLGHAELKTLLPHRHPMLLVDAVRSIEDAQIVGMKNVTGNEPCYGHVGERSGTRGYAYPCSLILESFAQTAGVLLTHRVRDAGAPDVVLLFVSVTGARFTGEDVLPGDTLVHHARLERILPGAAIVSGEVFVGERLIARIDRIIVAYRAREALEDRRPVAPSD
jgi:3-hydroxyacyl-[acyl-carrier-protein] dehydratase